MFQSDSGVMNKEHPRPDRRKAPRQNRFFIARCEVAGKKSFSTIVNLSSRGLGIYLENPVDVGTRIEILLQHEFSRGAYKPEQLNLLLPVRLVWIREEHPDEEFIDPGDNRFRAGLELEPLGEESRNRYRALLEAKQD
jgi:hypothetical protein